ncbi:hypothetical protein PSP6_270205 [Paraburkholderia tropica]|nr:hypothetical protein PSP6_270205 [Paraburkholderia tropica]
MNLPTSGAEGACESSGFRPALADPVVNKMCNVETRIEKEACAGQAKGPGVFHRCLSGIVFSGRCWTPRG